MSIDKLTIFKCSDPDCAALFEVVNPCECDSSCEISCCGKPMAALQAKTADAATEKHVPIIEPGDGVTVVKVGSVPHPMEEEHYIQWIELLDGDMLLRAYLKPGQAPEATFPIVASANASAREHCNVHGLWANA